MGGGFNANRSPRSRGEKSGGRGGSSTGILRPKSTRPPKGGDPTAGIESEVPYEERVRGGKPLPVGNLEPTIKSIKKTEASNPGSVDDGQYNVRTREVRQDPVTAEFCIYRVSAADEVFRVDCASTTVSKMDPSELDKLVESLEHPAPTVVGCAANALDSAFDLRSAHFSKPEVFEKTKKMLIAALGRPDLNGQRCCVANAIVCLCELFSGDDDGFRALHAEVKRLTKRKLVRQDPDSRDALVSWVSPPKHLTKKK